MAVEVTSEVLNSRDVTDEYVDLTARLKNLQATETALLRLLDRAEKVEDALKVQTELTKVQEDVERLQGRIKFLEQTSAFSLINVFMQLAPVDMPVDAGADQTFSVGQLARFQATFEPPEDVEELTFRWDFGDGSPPVHGNRTAPTLEEGRRITAVVSHVYTDDRTSPFIVEVEITGFGDAGVAEGKSKLIATVTRLPTIEVFAGDTRIAKEGEKVEFEGSFTRPKGLSDLTFRWDFGDGSTPVSESLEEGVTTAVATHEYSDHRPFAYTATLTIIAQAETGEVEAAASVQVLVTEARGWTVAGWSPGEQWKTAIRTLSGVGQAVATFLIWLAIFSPVWLGGGAVAVLVFRRARRGRASS
jgi:PKD repeat protein